MNDRDYPLVDGKIDYNKLSEAVHDWAVRVGWWDSHRDPYELLQLVVTEVAEATEGARRSMMDDHLPQYPMEQVELADAIIRLVDMAGRYQWEYIPNKYGYHRWLVRDKDATPISTGRMHFAIVSCVVAIGNLVEMDVDNGWSIGYTTTINTILRVAELRGYDLTQCILDKVEYNRTREDHKRESRQGEHGKKF